jgi:hypothetical protein
MEHCFEILRQSPSMMVRQSMLETLALRRGLDQASVRSDFERFVREGDRKGRSPEANAVASPPVQGMLRSADRDLLVLLLHFPEVRERVRNLDLAAMIAETSMEAALLRRVCAELHEDPFWGPESGFQHLCEDETQLNFFYQLLSEQTHAEEVSAQLDVCLRTLELRHCKRKMAQLAEAINRTPPGKEETLRDLMQKKIELQKKVASLSALG